MQSIADIGLLFCLRSEKRIQKGSGGMYRVLLAIKSESLRKAILELHIWGDSTGFEIADTLSDMEHLTEILQKQNYHLVLLEDLPEMHTVSLLRTIKKENLCQAVGIVSERVDFKSVRKCFLTGADDYFVPPFELGWFVALFRKIENAEHGKLAVEMCQKEELLTLFENVDDSIKDELDQILHRVNAEYGNSPEAEQYVKRITEDIVEELFDKYTWLDHYFSVEDCLGVSYDFLEYGERVKKRLEDFYAFYEEYAELYPPHAEKLDDILSYILNHPDADLKQKTIAEELYMNRSYLSTVFNAQIGLNFVEYINTVKLKRAAWLLRHTNRKVIDIASLLDYKDMGYFLKRFKAKYGLTPSQFRIPETYDFQI